MFWVQGEHVRFLQGEHVRLLDEDLASNYNVLCGEAAAIAIQRPNLRMAEFLLTNPVS